MVTKNRLTERGLEIQRLAAEGNVGELTVFLQSGFHHGKSGATQGEKALAAETLMDTYKHDEEKYAQLASELAVSAAPSARQVACALLQDLWVRDRAYTPMLVRLASDEDWEVREWAAAPFTKLLISDFAEGVALIRELLDHPHEGVLRAIALAVKGAAQKKLPESIDTLLELTEPLMYAESEYVRKNLGPFAIGDGLLRVYPDETLAKLRQWAEREAWPVRWNVVMSFSGAQGKKHVDTVAEILTLLADDERKEVQRAVKKVGKHLGKHVPEDERFRPFV